MKNKHAVALGRLGGSVKNKNRSKESYQEAGRKGGRQKGINYAQRKDIGDPK